MSALSKIKKISRYIITFIFVLFVLIWGASFFVLPWQVNKQLEPLNVSLHQDSSMSFNPFTLHFQVDDLSLVDDKDKQQLSLKHAHLNLSWIDIIFKNVILEAANINGLAVNVVREKQTLFVAGIDLSANGQPLEPEIVEEVHNKPQEDPLSAIQGWTFLLPQFLINDVVVNLNDHGHQQTIALKKLSIDALEASLDLFQADIDITAAINSGSIDISSNISAILKSNELLSATLNNSANIKGLSVQDWQYLLPLSENKINELAAQINLSLSQKVSFDEGDWKVIQPVFHFGIDNLKVIKPELSLLNDSIALSVNDLNVDGKDSQLKSVKGKADFVLNNTHVKTQEGDLAKLSQLLIPSITFSVDDKLEAMANIDSVSLTNILFSQLKNTDDAIYANEKLIINDIAWQNNHLSVDNIELAKFNTDVILGADKQLKNLVAVQATETESLNSDVNKSDNSETVSSEINEAASGTQETPAVTISLNSFTLMSPSHINFIDESVSPVFKQEIILNTVVVTNVDSRQKKALSPFDIGMSLGEHSTTTIQGGVAPFGDKLDMNLTVAMSELSLPPLSSYLRTVIGVDFLSGQLDNNINLVIKEDQMDGETVIDLRGFELTSGDDTTGVSTSTGSAMGLNSALNMLKDSQGNVSLEVPLSGDINDPSFGVSSILTLIVKKAIMSEAKSYLINTFVPYANVITVASIAGEYLLRVEMNDLNYDAGQVTLTDKQQPFVTQLAALLKDKPEQQVKMCAIASIDEATTLKNTANQEQKIAGLKEISQQRGDNLKKVLINEFDIKSSRLLLCAPRVDNDTATLPRIEFNF